MDPETIKAIDKASEVDELMIEGKMEEIEEKLEPMYKVMAKEIAKQKERLGGDWAIAQAVFSRNQREFLRKALGPDLVFIVLSMTKECTIKRLKNRDELILRHKFQIFSISRMNI